MTENNTAEEPSFSCSV